MNFQIEIFATSFNAAVAAQEGGAHCIELAGNFAEGGNTPSLGMIAYCKQMLSIPIIVMIRPRGGDFLYTDHEFEIMKQDIIVCKKLNCEGVIFGILDEFGNVNKERCRELVALARPMQVNFHRAYDRCNDLQKGLEDLIDIGFDKVLTSGGEVDAVDGVNMLVQLAEQARGRIGIIVCADPEHDRIFNLMDGMGFTEYHFAAVVPVVSAMKFKMNGKLGMADAREIIMETDKKRIEELKNAIHDLNKRY